MRDCTAPTSTRAGPRSPSGTRSAGSRSRTNPRRARSPSRASTSPRSSVPGARAWRSSRRSAHAQRLERRQERRPAGGVVFPEVARLRLQIARERGVVLVRDAVVERAEQVLVLQAVAGLGLADRAGPVEEVEPVGELDAAA